MGLGAGLLYIPSLAMVGVWFSKKRALAMGVVMSGIAVGMLDYSPCSIFVVRCRADMDRFIKEC
jgi:MFS family permease